VVLGDGGVVLSRQCLYIYVVLPPVNFMLECDS